RRIGYSPGSIYLAFANIDDVIAHLNTRTLAHMHTTMHRQIEAAAPAADQLRQCARAYVGFARAQPHLWRLCFEHVLPPGQTPPPGLDARIAALVDLLLQPLAQAIGR